MHNTARPASTQDLKGQRCSLFAANGGLNQHHRFCSSLPMLGGFMFTIRPYSALITLATLILCN